MTDTLVAKLLDGEPVESLTEATREMMKPIHAQPWEKLRICKANTGDKTKRTWFDCVAVIDPVAYLKHKHGDVPSEMQLADFVRPAISSSAATAWAARIPECEQIAYGRYLVADTDISVVTLCSVWPKGSFIFDSEETQMRFYYLYLRFQAQLEASKIRAEFKINGHIPDAPPGFIDHPKHPLSPYQFVAAATCLGQEAFCLFLDRGLGKTAIAINRIQNEARLIQEDETRRKTGRPLLVLVVAPKNVRHNWKSEIERFATLPGQVTILAGGQLDRIKQLIEAVNVLDKTVTWSVVIASYDSIPRSWDAIKMLPWDLCILDESHYIKATTSKRQAAFHLLRECCAKKMLLTGTPVGNTVLDLWGQLEFLGKGQSGFSSWRAFQRFYTQFEDKKDRGNKPKNAADAVAQGLKKVVGFKNMPLLQERLARLAFIGTKREFMPYLPDKIYTMVGVSMSPAQREAYIKVANELAAQIESEIKKAASGQKAMTINNILVKLLRLSQVTSGFLTWDEVRDEETGELLEAKKIEYLEPNPKIEALRKVLLNQDPGYKTIIWAVWKPDIARIMQMCKENGIDAVAYHGSMSDDDRLDAEYRFNCDPKCTVFVGNPVAGGVGLNLRGYDLNVPGETYADTTVFYSQNWSSLVRGQAEDRNHGRDRCRGPVEYIDLVVPGTIDEEIRRRVLEKQVMAAEIQDVRSIMQKLLDFSSIEDDDAED
jgi:SNF2 family DNA or RNA helicase